jgi:putative copper export protein
MSIIIAIILFIAIVLIFGIFVFIDALDNNETEASISKQFLLHLRREKRGHDDLDNF